MYKTLAEFNTAVFICYQFPVQTENSFYKSIDPISLSLILFVSMTCILLIFVCELNPNADFRTIGQPLLGEK